MQKVYLLLRQNQQTGPFDLQELLQFDLKPYDLIWIEGKSAGWYYPQEIEALRPRLPFLKQAPVPPPVEIPVPPAVAASAQSSSSKKIFVSMPLPPAKEEATPAPSVAAKPSVDTHFSSTSGKPVQEKAELKTAYSKPLDEVETDYMDWTVQNKAKKKPVFSKSGVMVLCVLAVAAFAAWKMNGPSTDAVPTTERMAQAPAQGEIPAANVASTGAVEAGKTPVVKKGKAARNKVSTERTSPSAMTASKQKQKDAAVTTTPVESNDYEAPVTKEEAEPVAEKTSEPVAAEAPKEKKKLRDKILDLFRKKPEEKKEEAKPVEESNGGRQSTRREAGSSLAQMVSVRFTIPNDWMMGIRGAKATLTNKSGETLAKAVVEVVYYNDDNEVLAKKTVIFNNVKSKQTQTVSVPEHETATRLEYNVVSALGAGEPVARL